MDKSLNTPEFTALLRVLRQVRLEAGLRQVDVAERVDAPQSFVSKYETGERRLDLVELGWIAQALGTDLLSIVRRYLDEVG